MMTDWRMLTVPHVWKAKLGQKMERSSQTKRDRNWRPGVLHGQREFKQVGSSKELSGENLEWYGKGYITKCTRYFLRNTCASHTFISKKENILLAPEESEFKKKQEQKGGKHHLQSITKLKDKWREEGFQDSQRKKVEFCCKRVKKGSYFLPWCPERWRSGAVPTYLATELPDGSNTRNLTLICGPCLTGPFNPTPQFLFSLYSCEEHSTNTTANEFF